MEQPTGAPPLPKLHPDAQYQGRQVQITQEIQGGISLKITVHVDPGDPSQWGHNSVTLWVEPIICETRIQSLSALAQIGWVLSGPLGDLIKDAVNKIDLNLVRPY